MKNLFQAVREAVPVPEVARCIGLEIHPGDMVRCPFHEDHTPSLKLYPDHYYCFGCHAHGDAVDLLTGCTELRPIDAARLLARPFGVGEPAASSTVPS